MAKSKSGGTRSYIRGRVGADVYSIGKDAKGAKQQVVRSLAETVANPQTFAQMRGRMIMSTIMQVVSGMKPIIDHSFDNVSGRQPNISEFISRNYALIKADVAANPASGNSFGLNEYLEKGAKRGAYVIADGSANVPAALVLTKADGVISIALDADGLTIGGLKGKLGMNSQEFFTLVGIATDGSVKYERFRINPDLSDETVISSANVASVFAVEGNAAATIAFAGTTISITLASVASCCAVIVSLKTTSGYIHNTAVLGAGTDFESTADVALPSYPIGNQDYLNGGDLFGLNEEAGEADEPEANPVVTAVTWNGSNVTIGGNTNGSSLSGTLAVTVDKLPSTGTLSLYQSANNVDKGDKIADFSATTLSQTVNGTSKSSIYLWLDDTKLEEVCHITQAGD